MMGPEPPLGIRQDTLFAALTRPAMKWGVTYSALLVNGITTIEMFLLTRNLLWLLICLPVYYTHLLTPCRSFARALDTANFFR